MTQQPQPNEGRCQAIAYIRQSQAEQRQRVCNPDRQLARVVAYCDQQGLRLCSHIRDEGVAGTTPLAQRPGGEELVRLVGEGQVGNLVVATLDRLFTTPKDAIQCVRGFRARGLTLHILDVGGKALTLSGAEGELFLRIAAGIAHMQQTTRSEHVQAALAQKKARGERVGTVPFGWQVADDGRTLIPNPAERALAQRAGAMQCDGIPVRQIAAILAAEGITTRRGTPLSRSSAHQLIQLRKRF
jgi:DNA invertase Pin-like site-specific DNA recombinase